MEDVIFSGSDARKPTATAEVRLRFSGVLKSLSAPAFTDAELAARGNGHEHTNGHAHGNGSSNGHANGHGQTNDHANGSGYTTQYTLNGKPDTSTPSTVVILVDPKDGYRVAP